jgi:hypothetical protein
VSFTDCVTRLKNLPDSLKMWLSGKQKVKVKINQTGNVELSPLERKKLPAHASKIHRGVSNFLRFQVSTDIFVALVQYHTLDICWVPRTGATITSNKFRIALGSHVFGMRKHEFDSCYVIVWYYFCLHATRSSVEFYR